jgi:hypothetical protein
VYSNGAPIGTAVYLESESTIFLCVKFFYYSYTLNSTSPSGQFLIIGSKTVNGNGTQLYDANSQFLIKENTTALSIGGPQNLNEGAVVTYSITSRSASPSGNYFIALGGISFPSMEACQTELELVVGNAQYVPGGGMCTAPLTAPSSPFGYTTNANGFIEGDLFTEIVGISD